MQSYVQLLVGPYRGDQGHAEGEEDDGLQERGYDAR